MRNPFKRSGQKTVKIVPNQKFRDGGDTFSPGQVYRIDIGRAYYFERQGWLEGSVASPPTKATLDIDDGILGHKAEF